MQNIHSDELVKPINIVLQLDVKCSEKSLKCYFEEIYNDLVFRWQGGNSNPLQLEAFEKYMEYPKIICEYLFHAIDKHGTHNISQFQFVNFLSTLFSGTIEQRLKIAFDVLDYDHDGFLKKEEVSFLLNYLHNYYISNEDDPSFPDLELFIDTTFQENPQMIKDDISAFQDLALLFLLFLSKYKPFESENVNSLFQEEKKRKKSKKNFTINPSNLLCKYLHQSLFSDEEENCELECLDNFETEKVKAIQEVLKEDVATQSNSCYTSPSKLFSGSKLPVSMSCEINNNHVVHECVSCSTSESEKEISELKGFVIQNDSLIPCIFSVLNNDLFCLDNKNSNDAKPKVKFHFNLKATFPERSECLVMNDTKYSTLALICSPYFQRNVTYLLFNSEEDRDDLLLHITKLKPFRNIQDYYEIYDEIGKGQFGVVKLGRSKLTKKHVAIKTISKKQIEDTHTHKIISREIDIFKFLQNSSHPSIVQAIDYFENSSHIFLIFEYIKGKNLKGYLRSQAKLLSINELKVIFSQIAHGLNFLHSHGIIHGDVKPENIMITQIDSKLHIKLIDFGLSQVISPSTCANDSQGSLCYCAPEILLRKSYNCQIDVWSFGILLYFMLYGDLPFYDNDNHVETVCSKIVKGKISSSTAMSRHAAGEDESMIKILINSCLQTKPQKRLNIKAIVNHKSLCIEL